MPVKLPTTLPVTLPITVIVAVPNKLAAGITPLTPSTSKVLVSANTLPVMSPSNVPVCAPAALPVKLPVTAPTNVVADIWVAPVKLPPVMDIVLSVRTVDSTLAATNVSEPIVHLSVPSSHAKFLSGNDPRSI
ncbi:MAG: Uncharacterised protein [Porticoccaceae bacterium UBA1117]|nr:MAG: Uncharacterised protein [Porticoccaceae bacterium UBA1117]